jgi:alkylation response protein AidB-like acyl-CoA dehydrogenase
MTLMNANESAAQSTAEFRERLRKFLTTNNPGPRPRDADARLAWVRRWREILADGGYAAPSWPRSVGGMELPFDEQVIYADEIVRARVPRTPGTGVDIAAPTIIRHGTTAQCERWLPAMLRAQEIWAQGWSEPDAGSDLPSLRTRARLDGDHYVVSGHKIWSSAADISDWLYCLVRTGPPESRRDGITYLVIDSRSLGVTIRPIRNLAGGSNFSEIFFDEVRVPVENRVGSENGGWPIARTSIGHERAAMAYTQATFYRRILDELLALARDRGAAKDPMIRQRLAEAETLVRIMLVSGARTIAHIIDHGEPGPTSSISRIFNTETEQLLHELAVDILGPEAILVGGDSCAVQGGRWTWGFLRTRGSTIGAGTAEIQRNTIAEQVLGLPRDPAMP